MGLGNSFYPPESCVFGGVKDNLDAMADVQSTATVEMGLYDIHRGMTLAYSWKSKCVRKLHSFLA